jgi:hypothetical protein
MHKHVYDNLPVCLQCILVKMVHYGHVHDCYRCKQEGVILLRGANNAQLKYQEAADAIVVFFTCLKGMVTCSMYLSM